MKTQFECQHTQHLIVNKFTKDNTFVYLLTKYMHLLVLYKVKRNSTERFFFSFKNFSAKKVLRFKIEGFNV